MSEVAVIQARMSSTRFPGKHLSPLAGKPMIDHVVAAVEKAEKDFVVATSDHPSDCPLWQYCAMRGWRFYRGSLDNPLERTYQAAREEPASKVIRITADCPLIDWRTIVRLSAVLDDDSSIDYVGETNSPDGDDCEVFRFHVLAAARAYASREECEHTTTWIRNNRKCISNESEPAFAGVHYSVNTIEDLRLCERILAACGEGAKRDDIVHAYYNAMEGVI